MIGGMLVGIKGTDLSHPNESGETVARPERARGFFVETRDVIVVNVNRDARFSADIPLSQKLARKPAAPPPQSLLQL